MSQTITRHRTSSTAAKPASRKPYTRPEIRIGPRCRGRKEARGGRDVWTVEAGDLAGWAQATGRRMTPPQTAADQPHGATGAVGQPAAPYDTLQERVRELERERDFLRIMLDQALRALPSGEPTQAEAPDRGALEGLQATVDRQVEENARLRRELEQRPWWERLFRGGGPGE